MIATGGHEDVRNDHAFAVCGDALASGQRATRLGAGVDGILPQEFHVSWRPALPALQLRPGTAVFAGAQPPKPASRRCRYVRSFCVGTQGPFVYNRDFFTGHLTADRIM